MSLSFLSPSRTVLLLSDEALYIYTTSSKGVDLIETIPWGGENFQQNVANIISKDCGRKPILILNDMVEQHYRKERVVKKGVGMLDKQSLIKRKLNVAFPNYSVKAAYPLKERVTKKDAGPAADIFIFAAIPNSSQFQDTIAAAKISLASISGFCLLPVEASDMVGALSAKLSKAKKSNAEWSIFIGQHKSGGLRQIVTKNGDMALTRMTPIIDDESDSGAWADEVHQEFKATMSYLARFGYKAEDGLDVIVVANPDAGERLEALIEEECNFTAITVVQAARMLGVPIGNHKHVRYADTLHVAWAGRKTKFVLPMKAVQIDSVSKPRQAALAASFLLFCSAAFFSYQFMTVAFNVSETGADIDSRKNVQSQLNAQYQREVQRKEELGFDVRLVQSSIAVRDELERQRIKALDVFDGVGRALGKDLRIDKVTINRVEHKVQKDPFGQSQTSDEPRDLFSATMQMTYPSTTDVDRGNKEVRDLRTRLERVLPGYRVVVSKFLKDYEYIEELVVETGDLNSINVQQDFIAEITIVAPEPAQETSL